MDPSPTARDLVRHLLAREIAAEKEPDAIGAGLQRLCSRVSENLRRSLGADGRDALLQRAFTRTKNQHPVLTEIGQTGETGISIDSIVAGVNTHGAPAVTAAVESLLVTLADILAGLIGADMVTNLLDHDHQNPNAQNGRQNNDQ
jgi:hypothetical protein